MITTSRRLLLAVFVLLGLVGAACSSSSKSSAPTTTAAPAVTGNITVFAAASLTASFNAIGAAFMQANPGAKVTFSYDASSALVQEIVQGAPADVFASADTTNMGKLTTP